MTNPNDWTTWLASNPPPSLQQLATAHGGCGLIPPAAWGQWDIAVSQWEAARRDRLLGSRTWQQLQPRKLRPEKPK